MKRFLLTLATITLLSCFLIFISSTYEAIVLVYHAIVMGVIYTGVYYANLILRSFPIVPKQKNIFIIILNGIIFYALIFFYLATLISNALWKKTITFSILKNYIHNLGGVLDIVPIEKWIILTTLLIFLFLISLLFIKIVPTTTSEKKAFYFPNWKTPKIFIPALLFICALFSIEYLKKAKRAIHFAEEPLLQFVFGGMWGLENELAFDSIRYSNGLKDSTCINNIEGRQPSRNVILILIDGLRADHLSTYGYTRKTTPFLDSLLQSKSLIKVKHSFSPSTMTIGGIAGMFFSKDWTEFGFNGLSLMKFMQQSGFKTYAFLTGFHRDWYGLSALYRGSCDFYYESSKNPEVKNDDDFITLREFNKTKIPHGFFAYIHLLSVHTLGKRHLHFRPYQPDKIGFSVPREIALVNNYDNGVLQADYVVKQIFHKLKTENLLNNSTIVITSDHGEMLGEEDTWGHGGNVHRALLNIPLLIFDQNIDWYKNTEAATLKDIAPTIATRIGSEVPECWEGTSLNQPANTFILPVNSVEECQFPFGNLSYQNNTFKLEIMNNKHQKIKEVIWHP
ncbi:sulfatase-like hydrolase/transferase [Paracnuella aquatica]|uniref:sulfatase-like hydrolase/transferase n=1 Tax=Paracnuella aquatica TaxID=2268757 RepID=UPI000DEEFDF4|nr:sulfatase-like hydrolase/transferase [Paracnuella aquatica]RPD50728.1 hypothetical protein DRJ53_07350 [Paracnuella aquatica]